MTYRNLKDRLAAPEVGIIISAHVTVKDQMDRGVVNYYSPEAS